MIFFLLLHFKNSYPLQKRRMLADGENLIIQGVNLQYVYMLNRISLQCCCRPKMVTSRVPTSISFGGQGKKIGYLMMVGNY